MTIVRSSLLVALHRVMLAGQKRRKSLQTPNTLALNTYIANTHTANTHTTTTPVMEKIWTTACRHVACLGLSAALLGSLPSVGYANDQSEAVISQPPITTRIIGGQSVREGAWPSTVALLFARQGTLFARQFCAGTVIAERWVLTAAHCLHSETGEIMDPSALRVGAGVTNLQNENSVREVTVTSLFLHPDYIPGGTNTRNDIALMELAQPTGVPALPLYAGDPENIPGSPAIVVGWGAINFSETEPLVFPTALQQATVPLVSRAVCNLPQSYNGAIAEGQMCAGFQSGGVDACVGDSGGPLMVLEGGEFRQVGVVSFGRGCALPNLYGIYTHTGFYSTWINELVSGQADVRLAEAIVPGSNTTASGGSGSLSFGLFVLMLLVPFRLRRQVAFSPSE